jgi:hypothetical protein
MKVSLPLATPGSEAPSLSSGASSPTDEDEDEDDYDEDSEEEGGDDFGQELAATTWQRAAHAQVTYCGVAVKAVSIPGRTTVL